MISPKLQYNYQAFLRLLEKGLTAEEAVRQMETWLHPTRLTELQEYLTLLQEPKPERERSSG